MAGCECVPNARQKGGSSRPAVGANRPGTAVATAKRATGKSIGRYAASNRSESCTAAPRSTFVDAEGQCNVTACQTGQHTVSIATNSSAECIDTAAGYYLHNRTLRATLCPAGRFSSSINSLYCSLCGVGKYSSTGASSCSLCQEGRYQIDPGQSSCDLCPYQ